MARLFIYQAICGPVNMLKCKFNRNKDCCCCCCCHLCGVYLSWNLALKRYFIWVDLLLVSVSIMIIIIIIIIVSVTKFSIVTGSLRAYLSRNRRAIMWVSNYRSPIWTFSNRTPVIGYPRDFHINHARFNGFLSNVFQSFKT